MGNRLKGKGKKELDYEKEEHLRYEQAMNQMHKDPTYGSQFAHAGSMYETSRRTQPGSGYYPSRDTASLAVQPGSPSFSNHLRGQNSFSSQELGSRVPSVSSPSIGGMNNVLSPYQMHQTSGELAYEIPGNCRVILPTDQVHLLDFVGTNKGLAIWRADNATHGVCLAKVFNPVITRTATATSTLSQGTRTPRRTRRTPEEIFDTELEILCYIQGNYQPNMLNSPANLQLAKERERERRDRSPRRKYQHENIISFIGYMEASIPLQQNDIEESLVERRFLTEFYVDTLRSQIEHRTQTGKKEMKYYEAILYAFHIAKGLSVLHRKGVCHRDLCSENIIMGFGLLDKEYKEWLRYIAKEETDRYFSNYHSDARSNVNESSRRSNVQNMTKPSVRNSRKPSKGNRHAYEERYRKSSAQREHQLHYYKFLQTLPLVAKISNLGQAKILQTKHGKARTKTRIGSVQFMAPEMFRGEEYDYSCDIWSFGAILYEMITSKPPFHKKPVASYIEQKVLTGKFPRNEQIGSKSFENLQVVMRNCLKTEPALRSSARELVEDLSKI